MPRPAPSQPPATTSLPETPGGNRNYDYRFTWIRDATFALWGLYSLGFDWEAVDFFAFIADLVEGEDDIQIMYGIGGEKKLTEHELDHLPGYANSRPVRIGNAAYAQKQHDVWGALLDSVYLHFKAANHLDNRIWTILDKQVSEALKYWREPDAGIWEVRGELQALHLIQDHVLGCRRPRRQDREDDRGGGQGRGMGAGGAGDQGRHLGQRRRRPWRADPVLRHARRSTRHCCWRLWSASCPLTTRCIKATVLAIADELTVDGLVLRYRVEETDDGFERRGGQLHDLLVLAGLGALRDR